LERHLLVREDAIDGVNRMRQGASLVRVAGQFVARLVLWLGVAVYVTGFARIVLWFRRRVPRVVAYHACEADESGFTRGLRCNTSPATLAKHLDFYRRFYSVVPLEALFEGELPPCPLVASTLESGELIWVNQLNWYLARCPQALFGVLRQRVEIDVPSRPEELVTLLRDHLNRGQIVDLLDTVRNAPSAIEVPSDERAALYLGLDDIRIMAAHGVTFGNHSMHHMDLSRLSPQKLLADLTISDRILVDVPGFVRSLAYPFGQCDERARRVLSGLGYGSVLGLQTLYDPTNPPQLPRVPIADESVPFLFSRLEIIEPLKRGVKSLIASSRKYLTRIGLASSPDGADS